MKRISIGLAILLGVLLGTAPGFARLAPWAQAPASLAVAPPPQGEWPRALEVDGKAQLLIATRQVRGPFFAQSVVLLIQHTAGGALGLILNRPIPALITDLLPELRRLTQRQDRVHVGGPVDPELMIFLIHAKESPPEATTVLDDVYATASADALREVIKNDTPANRFRAYVGYAGWGPGQLDAEIARGDWYLAPAAAGAIFDSSPDDLWQRLVIEHEGIQVRRKNRPDQGVPAS